MEERKWKWLVHLLEPLQSSRPSGHISYIIELPNELMYPLNLTLQEGEQTTAPDWCCGASGGASGAAGPQLEAPGAQGPAWPAQGSTTPAPASTHQPYADTTSAQQEEENPPQEPHRLGKRQRQQVSINSWHIMYCTSNYFK